MDDASRFLSSVLPGQTMQCVCCGTIGAVADHILTPSTDSLQVAALRHFHSDGWKYGYARSVDETGPLCEPCWDNREDPTYI